MRRRDALIAAGGFLDAPLRGERGERLTDAGRAQAARVPQFGQGEGAIGVRQDVLERVRRRGPRGRRRRGRLHEVQGERVVPPAQRQGQAGLRRGRAMLDAEEQSIVDAAQIEIGVAPRMEFGAAAQGLPGADGVGALARVVDL